MKKILLFIILLFPLFVFAKENYRIETSEKISGVIAEIIDNGDAYILQSDESIAHIDKKTGAIKTLPFIGEKAWGNYNKEKNKLEPKETTHYLIYESGNSLNDYEENGYLVDKDFNIISTIDASNIDIDVFFINNHIIANASSGHQIKIEVYNNNLEHVKTVTKETDCTYDYYEDRNIFFSSNSYCENDVYTVNDDLEIEKVNTNKYVYFDNHNVYIRNINTDTIIKTVNVTNNGYIDELFYYKGYYFVHYDEDDYEKHVIVQYDEDLNEIRRKDISSFEGIDHDDTAWLMYFNGQMFFEAKIENHYGNNVRIFYDIDENLNLIPSSSIGAFKSNVMTSSDYKRLYPDAKGLLIARDMYESLLDHEMGDILDIKKIKDKYYALSFTVDYDDEYKVLGYISIFDNNKKLIKKAKIHDVSYDELSTRFAFGCLNYVDNKVIASFSYPEGTFIKTIDLDGEILDIDFEITDSNFLPFYSIIEGNTTITTSVDESYYMSKLSNNTAEGYKHVYSKVIYFKSMNDTNIVSDHGEVKIPDDVYYGDEVELDIKPDNGYVVKEIIIKDRDGKLIPVINNKFIMPNGDITIDVIYELDDKSVIKEIIENPYTLDIILVVFGVAIVSLIAVIYNKKKVKELN